MPLEILAKTEHWIAISKPSGLLVHRSLMDAWADSNVVQILRQQLGQAVWPVHRLDKATSGVLLLALNQDAARILGAQFMANSIAKTYQALVRGWLIGDGEINYPLSIKRDHFSETTVPEGMPPQSAQSSYFAQQHYRLPYPVDRYPEGRYTLTELKPHTGRRHQLRRHMKHIAHPIIGDTRFGKGSHNRYFREHFGIHRLFLHASQLCFKDPATERQQIITSPMPDELQALLEQLKSFKVTLA